MDKKLQSALIERLTGLADDELLLAHRNAEWTGHAPILEADIALANIAQDELGHAVVWFGLLEDITGRDADEMAMFRDAAHFRNVQMVELPRGDWAFTTLRQYLFDAYERVLLVEFADSSYAPLAAAAAKMRNEELYHLRYTHTWVERLGLGSAESNRRMQAALDDLWRSARQLFVEQPGDDLLVAAGIIPEPGNLERKWRDIVVPHLSASNLRLPDELSISIERNEHTEHLEELLAAMQLVARSDPDAVW